MEVDGRRLHYVDTSPVDCEPLGTIVLLHGASSNLVEIMLLLGSALQAHYRVIAFDRPGHGWSERESDPAAALPSRQAAVIAQALRLLGVEKAIVVGHSWSGSVAPNLGLDHTDVAGALLILSGVTHPWPGGAIAWYNRLSASWLGWLFTRTLTTPIGLLLFRSAAYKTFAPQDMPPDFLDKARIRLLFRPKVFHANARDIGVLFRAVSEQSARYPDIRIPVVVIAGDADEIVWTDLHSRSLACEVPGAELVVLPGIGHMPHYARPDLVIARIEALAERSAKASAGIMPERHARG
jgi:pimeloyl-ACP methyl ester carboxylesterase